MQSISIASSQTHYSLRRNIISASENKLAMTLSNGSGNCTVFYTLTSTPILGTIIS